MHRPLCAPWKHRLFEQWLNPLCNIIPVKWAQVRRGPISRAVCHAVLQGVVQVEVSDCWVLFCTWRKGFSLAHLYFFFSVTCAVMCNLLAQCVCVRVFQLCLVSCVWSGCVWSYLQSTGSPSDPFSTSTINLCVPASTVCRQIPLHFYLFFYIYIHAVEQQSGRAVGRFFFLFHYDCSLCPSGIVNVSQEFRKSASFTWTRAKTFMCL